MAGVLISITLINVVTDESISFVSWVAETEEAALDVGTAGIVSAGLVKQALINIHAQPTVLV